MKDRTEFFVAVVNKDDKNSPPASQMDPNRQIPY